MQTRIVDHGASLKQTLKLLDRGREERRAISRVRVFDEKRAYVDGLNDQAASATEVLSEAEQIVWSDSEDILRTWFPMKDVDAKTVGYLEIHFSKGYLQAQSG